MRTTLEIIEAMKRKLSVTSDYALAKKMRWRTPRVSNYRNGVSHLDTFAALQAAEVLGEPPLKIIAIVEAERTKRPDQKRRWQELAKASVVATAMIAGGIFSPGEAKASPISPQFLNPDIHYTTRRRWRLESLFLH